MRKHLIYELANNKQYFISSLFISIYVFLPQVFIAHSLEQILGVLVSFFILFLISKVNKAIFLFLFLFTLLANSLLLHIVYNWGNDAIRERIQAALLSPEHEMIEYLLTYLNFSDLFISFYFFFGIYLLYNRFIRTHNTYKKIKVISISLLLALLFILNSLSLAGGVIPFKYINILITANEWKAIVDKRKKYLKNHEKVKNTLQKENLLYDKIIIIMGESVNKHHMEAYGYNIPNTPFLSKLLQQNNSVKFNVIAPTNLTRYSVPIALTDTPLEHFYDFITSESIISNFKKYGYTTYWLSNQYQAGMHDSYVSSLAAEADYSEIKNFVFEDDGNADSELDIVLVDHLKKINKNNKELYIFHLLGSHFKYPKRYSTDHALFPNPKNITEEYDNTIFYTDYVLNEIYNKFKNTKSLFIYVSDHGEVVNEKKSGHGFFPAYKDEYDIPLIIHSREYSERLLKLKIENKKHLFNMEDFNHIIKYLAGIDSNLTAMKHNTKVFVLDPKNIIDYYKIDKFK